MWGKYAYIVWGNGGAWIKTSINHLASVYVAQCLILHGIFTEDALKIISQKTAGLEDFSYVVTLFTYKTVKRVTGSSRSSRRVALRYQTLMWLAYHLGKALGWLGACGACVSKKPFG